MSNNNKFQALGFDDIDKVVEELYAKISPKKTVSKSHVDEKEMELRLTLQETQVASTHPRLGVAGVLPSQIVNTRRSKATPQTWKHLMKGKGNASSDGASSFHYAIIIDYECSCEEGQDNDFPHEIIEFPAILLNLQSLVIEDIFHSFVRPVIRPKLTPFCMRLTHISQSDVDSAPTLPEVLVMFKQWLSARNLRLPMGYDGCVKCVTFMQPIRENMNNSNNTKEDEKGSDGGVDGDDGNDGDGVDDAKRDDEVDVKEGLVSDTVDPTKADADTTNNAQTLERITKSDSDSNSSNNLNTTNGDSSHSDNDPSTSSSSSSTATVPASPLRVVFFSDGYRQMSMTERKTAVKSTLDERFKTYSDLDKYFTSIHPSSTPESSSSSKSQLNNQPEDDQHEANKPQVERKAEGDGDREGEASSYRFTERVRRSLDSLSERQRRVVELMVERVISVQSSSAAVNERQRRGIGVGQGTTKERQEGIRCETAIPTTLPSSSTSGNNCDIEPDGENEVDGLDPSVKHTIYTQAQAANDALFALSVEDAVRRVTALRTEHLRLPSTSTKPSPSSSTKPNQKAKGNDTPPLSPPLTPSFGLLRTAFLASDGPWDFAKFLIPECIAKGVDLLSALTFLDDHFSTTLPTTSIPSSSSSSSSTSSSSSSSSNLATTTTTPPPLDSATLTLPAPPSLPQVAGRTQHPSNPSPSLTLSLVSPSPNLQFLDIRRLQVACFGSRSSHNSWSLVPTLNFHGYNFLGKEHCGLADSLNITRLLILAAQSHHCNATPVLPNTERAMDDSPPTLSSFLEYKEKRDTASGDGNKGKDRHHHHHHHHQHRGGGRGISSSSGGRASSGGSGGGQGGKKPTNRSLFHSNQSKKQGK